MIAEIGDRRMLCFLINRDGRSDRRDRLRLVDKNADRELLRDEPRKYVRRNGESYFVPDAGKPVH